MYKYMLIALFVLFGCGETPDTNITVDTSSASDQEQMFEDPIIQDCQSCRYERPEELSYIECLEELGLVPEDCF